MTTFSVQNCVAFVTGTTKPNGLGRAIVLKLLEGGAKKVYATARQSSQLDDLVQQYPTKVVAVSLDVTDFAAVANLPKEYPDVQLVVNNAGYLARTGSLADVDVARQEMEINYLAPLAIAKAFASQLSNENTALVNISSIVSFVNISIGGTYCATKAATHSLTQAQRRDFPNALVIGVYPGPIETDMAKGWDIGKATPSSIADRIVAALISGQEDVFPDATSTQMYAGYKADAKAMERQMATA